MNEIKQIRMIQLTASLLLRMNSDISIVQANSLLFDFIIETYGDKSKCLVRVVDEDFFENESVNLYLDTLRTKEASEEMGGYPLCLMKVDEQALSIDFQIVARDDWGEYDVVKEINLYRMNEDGLKWLISESRQWNHIITLLDRDVHGILKSIRLTNDTYGHRVPANIIYIREFTAEYKMNPQEPSNDDEVREKWNNAHMQKEYPHDILDDAILDAVRSAHPEATIWNDLLITTDQYKTLLRQQKLKRMESAQIRILPDVSAMPPEHLAWIRSIEALQFEVDIFAEDAKQIEHLYDNEGYELRLPMNDWVNTLNGYSQVLRTLHRVRDVVR